MKSSFTHRVIRILCAAALSVSLTPVPRATAADTFWTAGSDNFTNPAAWSAGVPGGGDSAFFNLASSYTVSLTSDETTSNAFFNPTSGNVTFDLGANAWTVTDLFRIGDNAGANSTVTITGGTLVVTNAAGTTDFAVGRFGLGALYIDGGTVLSQIGTVGVTGNGNLIQVSGSGTIWSNSASYFLGYSGVNSRIVVTNNAQFYAGSGILHIGYAGKTNSLIITDGGVVHSTNVNFSTDAGSGARDNSALVTGNNSVWNNTGSILVGLNGGGNSMVVSNNATVNTATLNVGHASGTNTLTIYSGATVRATNVNISLAGSLASNRIIVAGGSLIVTNSTGVATLNLGGVNSELSLQGGLVRADTLTMFASTLNNAGGTVTASPTAP